MAIKKIGAFLSLICAYLHNVWKQILFSVWLWRSSFWACSFWVQIFCVGLLRGLGDPCSHSLNAGHVRHGRHREDTVIGDNHQLPLQELGWSFKTINHLSDLLTGVLTEKAKYANSRVWTFSFSILNDVSVAMSLCWSAVKGKNGILNTEMLGVPG